MFSSEEGGEWSTELEIALSIFADLSCFPNPGVTHLPVPIADYTDLDQLEDGFIDYYS